MGRNVSLEILKSQLKLSFFHLPGKIGETYRANKNSLLATKEVDRYSLVTMASASSDKWVAVDLRTCTTPAAMASSISDRCERAAILAMERMAMEHSNRPMMARYLGMLVAIAKATEREMNEELSGIPALSVTAGQTRLAKPLLVSLLVAM